MLLSVLVLLGIFFILVMMGVPIAVSIALASVSTLMLSMSFDPNTLSCMLFGSISGSAVAATSAIGTFMIPTMEKEGYDKNFSTAVTVTGSILGLLIPPSNVLIVYAVAAGSVSIAALFMAGYVPGILAGLALMIVAAGYAKKEGYPRSARIPMRAAAKKLLQAGPSILMIFIVVGGIIAGIFTATEASAIAVIYALVLSLIYKEINVKDLPEILLKSIETTDACYPHLYADILAGRYGARYVAASLWHYACA